MKKFLVKIFAIILCFCSLFCLTACKKDKLCGEWRVDSFLCEVDGEWFEYSLQEAIDIYNAEDLPDDATNEQKADKIISEFGYLLRSAVYEFNNDGKMYLKYNEENVVEFDWERKEEGVLFVKSGEVKDSVYTLCEFEDDDTMIYYTTEYDNNIYIMVFLVR